MAASPLPPAPITQTVSPRSYTGWPSRQIVAVLLSVTRASPDAQASGAHPFRDGARLSRAAPGRGPRGPPKIRARPPQDPRNVPNIAAVRRADHRNVRNVVRILGGGSGARQVEVDEQ